MDGTYNHYSITYTLKVAENTSYDPRTASLTISAGNLTKTFNVSQDAAQKPEEPEEKPDDKPQEIDISKTLVTENATNEA
jgi:hypothetical protein